MTGVPELPAGVATDGGAAASEGPSGKRVVVHLELSAPSEAASALARESGLSKTRIKDAMSKGAVWLRRSGGRPRRLRRATAALAAGDAVDLYYAPGILAAAPLTAGCVVDLGEYSAWDKPAGLLAQGSRWGDHCSLVRQVERSCEGGRTVFLVHRLDREASGLMLLAHARRTAHRLSAAFQARAVVKTYRARVLGDPGAGGEIDARLDGRGAETGYRRLAFDGESAQAELEITIRTGRKHQIRRHLAGHGYPVVGDRRYGDPGPLAPLALRAVALEFECPLSGKRIELRLDEASSDAHDATATQR